MWIFDFLKTSVWSNDKWQKTKRLSETWSKTVGRNLLQFSALQDLISQRIKNDSENFRKEWILLISLPRWTNQSLANKLRNHIDTQYQSWWKSIYLCNIKWNENSWYSIELKFRE